MIGNVCLIVLLGPSVKHGHCTQLDWVIPDQIWKCLPVMTKGLHMDRFNHSVLVLEVDLCYITMAPVDSTPGWQWTPLGIDTHTHSGIHSHTAG